MTANPLELLVLQQLSKKMHTASMFLSLMISFMCLSLLLVPSSSAAQEHEAAIYSPELSIARNWNEAMLFAIRRDFARPTVHARNLFHASALMYDSWALYAQTPGLYFLGRTEAPDNTPLNACAFSVDVRAPWQSLDADEVEAARQTTLSFALYRLLKARFADSPGAYESGRRMDDLFTALGFDSTMVSSDISEGQDPAKLGNYLAECVLAYGRTDGSNESNNYANSQYTTSNPPLDPTQSGNPGLNDPNRWQSLQLNTFIDQSGNQTDVPIFLGAEWNEVEPFALASSDTRLVTILTSTLNVLFTIVLWHSSASLALA